MRLGSLLMAGVLAVSAPLAGANAATFKWANTGDVTSMDPTYFNETFLLFFMGNIYEGLARRGKDLGIEPALATKWEQTNPTTWRFTLRQGVKFQGGEPFTADDVIFSMKRASEDGSDLRGNLAAISDYKKIDDYTVDILTKEPDPILPNEILSIYIMSKQWAEKNNAVHPTDVRKKEEGFATRNANGTGPFMLKSREPDIKTVLVKNPTWWDKPEHNLDEVIFTPIKANATRVAALISGEVDMIYEVPLNDVDRINKTEGRKVLEGPEMRTIFLGMDQYRDELLGSNVKGKNPFKDVRVRKAIYQAIDIEAIKTRVMRNAATPQALMITPQVGGFPADLNKRFPYDPEASKKLLAEAGYPEGFEVAFDCPNDRYVFDEQICLSIVPMLKRVGITAKLTAESKATYFPKILSRNTSFYLLGWTPDTYDALNTLFNIMATPDGQSRGKFNLGKYSNAKVDELTAKIGTEVDQTKRNAMIKEAFQIHTDEVGHIPLHQQALAWGVKSNVNLVQLADNRFFLRWVKVN